MTKSQNNRSKREAAYPRGTRYGCILMDVPLDIGQRGPNGAERHYPLLSSARIQELPVAELAADDCALWYWVYNGAIKEGIETVEKFGFKYRSILTWIKPRLGMGGTLRQQTEHLILATRGRPALKFRSQGTWMYAPLQDHSHKPEEQFAVIERMYDGPYLEMFARRRPLSDKPWHVWGDSIDSDIVVPGFPVPSDGRHGREARHE
ncbi:N6-adenosine-specific RNA methylase IME4 [Microbacterium testaceum]|uniref:MT-A70 family methyltransferase n=1 Tax=Microbacterium testaceum TaxID=2033 RepID=UPI002785293A|nr:MT-A70 family methyltransferase [Microbacterium testaceum]MDQ1175021.1 N6-adenosine-specific RNA methylase IME4 [Microbacterium testaceum]